MAEIWRPHPGIWINPAVQAGTPCVDGTRVPTSLLAGLVNTSNGSAPAAIDDEVCDDYRLTSEQVGAALAYELALAS